MKITHNNSLIAKIGNLVIALAIPFATVKSAHAIIFVDNLSETFSGGLEINSTVDQGSSFTTDNNSYTLNSVTVSLQEFTEDDIFINIYTNNAGQPGTVIEQLSTSADIANGDFNNYLFTPTNTVNLDADTTYWLIGSTSVGNYVWANTNSFNETGAWTIQDGHAFSINGGIIWNQSSEEPLQFNVDADLATATPVPFEINPTMGILLLGGLFIGKKVYRKYGMRNK